MEVKPQSTRQVREVLRDLAAQMPADADELAHVQRGSLLLALHIQEHGLGTDMPEMVWHFLSDADIRYKSPEYRVGQVAELLSALAAWELAEKPA